MQVSARILGQEYGLTAQEMNRVLVKQGFLQGTPGDYSLTQKGLQYAEEKNFHRGTGGYACYNRYWTTRTFDDSIKDDLDVPPELINEVRGEGAADRAAQAAARAQANAEFLEKQAAEKAAQEAAERSAREAAERSALEVAERIAEWEKVGKIGLAISVAAILWYGIYKATPKVRQWWNDRKSTFPKDKEIVTKKD